MLVASVYAATLAATALAWRGARWLDVVAVPNARSSHEVPTATMGGVGFVIVIATWIGAAYGGGEGGPEALGLLAGGLALAVLGLVDDVVELGARPRLLTQLLVIGACVTLLFPVPGWLAALLILGIAWAVNLYNFMDGIDGIAASQAAVYGIGVVALAAPDAAAGALPLLRLAWVLLAAALAFLCFNWAPAKIFMGDVGSGFLGFVVAMLAVMLWLRGQLPLVASLILFAAFWFDASYTLCVRILTRQSFTDAHRTHLYQRVARRVGHGWTTTTFWFYGLFWLLPLAKLSLLHPEAWFGWLALACMPVLGACVWMRAGLPSGTPEV